MVPHHRRSRFPFLQSLAYSAERAPQLPQEIRTRAGSFSESGVEPSIHSNSVAGSDFELVEAPSESAASYTEGEQVIICNIDPGFAQTPQHESQAAFEDWTREKETTDLSNIEMAGFGHGHPESVLSANLHIDTFLSNTYPSAKPKRHDTVPPLRQSVEAETDSHMMRSCPDLHGLVPRETSPRSAFPRFSASFTRRAPPATATRFSTY